MKIPGPYVRSASEDKFEDYHIPNAMVVWLDLLGTKKLTHDQIIQRLDELLKIAEKISSFGPFSGSAFYGTPQSRFQYVIVGDALVMAQKAPESEEALHAPQLALLEGALEVSNQLFQVGIPHRAAVCVGKVQCKISNRAAIITGEAVLNAFLLESKIKTMGVYLSESCTDFALWYKKYHSSHKPKKRSLECLSIGRRSILVQGILSAFLGKEPRTTAFLYEKSQHESLCLYLQNNPKAKKVMRTRLLIQAVERTTD